jgi:hypothetical protein
VGRQAGQGLARGPLQCTCHPGALPSVSPERLPRIQDAFPVPSALCCYLITTPRCSEARILHVYKYREKTVAPGHPGSVCVATTRGPFLPSTRFPPHGLLNPEMLTTPTSTPPAQLTNFCLPDSSTSASAMAYVPQGFMCWKTGPQGGSTGRWWDLQGVQSV